MWAQSGARATPGAAATAAAAAAAVVEEKPVKGRRRRRLAAVTRARLPAALQSLAALQALPLAPAQGLVLPAQGRPQVAQPREAQLVRETPLLVRPWGVQQAQTQALPSAAAQRLAGPQSLQAGGGQAVQGSATHERATSPRQVPLRGRRQPHLALNTGGSLPLCLQAGGAAGQVPFGAGICAVHTPAEATCRPPPVCP